VNNLYELLHIVSEAIECILSCLSSSRRKFWCKSALARSHRKMAGLYARTRLGKSDSQILRSCISIAS